MISVALVDDHKLLRNGLGNFIRSSNRFGVLFEADNGLEMQHKLADGKLPDVILMDINMPLMDGYMATDWLREHQPDIKVLALSMYDGEDCIIRMLRYGAKGYILKDAEPSELLNAIDEVHRHGFYYSAVISPHLRQLLRINDPKKQTNAGGLTTREMELLQHMASDDTYKEIADKMFLSPKTVEGYREKLCDKLQIKTRVGLVMYAIKNGIVKV
jgi:DNA-binding NarL/FixJ family response regulator